MACKKISEPDTLFWEHIFKIAYKQAFSMIRGSCREPEEDAKDIAQNALIKLYQFLRRGQKERSRREKEFLTRMIVRRLVYNKTRDNNRHLQIHQEMLQTIKPSLNIDTSIDWSLSCNSIIAAYIKANSISDSDKIMSLQLLAQGHGMKEIEDIYGIKYSKINNMKTHFAVWCREHQDELI